MDVKFTGSRWAHNPATALLAPYIASQIYVKSSVLSEKVCKRMTFVFAKRVFNRSRSSTKVMKAQILITPLETAMEMAILENI